MAEIKINIAELNNSISKMQSLKSKCSSNQKTAPKTVGGGKTVNELESIAALYRTIDSNLETMILNTISFLTNLRDSFVASDQKAANGVNGGGSSGGAGTSRKF